MSASASLSSNMVSSTAQAFVDYSTLVADYAQTDTVSASRTATGCARKR